MCSYLSRYLVIYFGSFETRKRQRFGGEGSGGCKNVFDGTLTLGPTGGYICRSYAGLKCVNRSRGSQREAEYISVCSSDRHVVPSDKVLNSV